MGARITQFKKILFLCILLWFFMLFGVSRMFLVSDAELSSGNDKSLETLLGKDASPDEIKKIKSSLEKIEKLQKQNELLQQRLDELKNPNKATLIKHRSNAVLSASEYLVPTKNFEYSRRRLENGIIEFWRYASTHLEKLFMIKDSAEAQSVAKEMHEFLTEHRRVILKDFGALEEAAGLIDWKEERSKEISRLVQNRLERLQNPKDCSEVKRLRCNINKSCGFGCQIHHVSYCLLAGYALNRTVILDSKNWRYSKKGWESVFIPLSSTCKSKHILSDLRTWRDDPQIAKELVVDMPIVDVIQGSAGRPSWLPLSVPDDLFPRIQAFHKNPPIWWIGQLVAYLWRYQPDLQSSLNEKAQQIKFESPVVGVHIRRTDKVGTEAARHEVDEYMQRVREYYDQQDVIAKVPVRRVYLATDDASVFRECKKKYPEYEIIGDPDAMESAALSKRYSDASLKGVITDLHFLSKSDHIVCTFSSQICRLAYELMQARLPDASDNYDSLDDIYYFGGQNANNFEAILPHTARNSEEISFKRGDLIGIAGNHWDGYSMGEHILTGRKGIFPSYKAIENFVIAKMPRYEDKSEL